MAKKNAACEALSKRNHFQESNRIDTANRETLLLKLKEYGIRGKMWDNIKSIYQTVLHQDKGQDDEPHLKQWSNENSKKESEKVTKQADKKHKYNTYLNHYPLLSH